MPGASATQFKRKPVQILMTEKMKAARVKTIFIAFSASRVKSARKELCLVKHYKQLRITCKVSNSSAKLKTFRVSKEIT